MIENYIGCEHDALLVKISLWVSEYLNSFISLTSFGFDPQLSRHCVVTSKHDRRILCKYPELCVDLYLIGVVLNISLKIR